MARIFAWIIMLLGGGALGLWLDRRWFYPWLMNPIFHMVSFVIGFLFLRLVFRASRNTGRWLAQMGRQGDLPRMETNRLVTTGYYECMRHPMYFGLLLFPFAFAFLLGSVAFILFIAPAEALLMILMIKLIEEPGAIRKFGDAYRDYRQKTPMFSLRWNCIKKLFQREKTALSDSA